MKRFFVLCSLLAACHSADKPSPGLIQSLNLKNGNLILCGPSSGDFGSVQFVVSSPDEIKKDFNQAVAMLHSFEYDEAEKAFAGIIAKDASCAMAYWGVAMSNYHPLWEPPNEAEVKKGAKAIAIARSVKDKTPRETAYIEALGKFYDDYDKIDHKTRCVNYEKAMERLYTAYPDDNEAAIFYALALNTTADPTDKTYAHQKKAGEILNNIYRKYPGHPGIIHYIIHNYDNPDLADLALEAARKYASVAPASAHAQHMPSHIFTRLGLWDESVRSNIASVSSARCYAESAPDMAGWDEGLHGMDYLMYAYLQEGDNEKAKAQWDSVRSIHKVYVANMKVAYALAAIPARYVLENKLWKEAAGLEFYPADFKWNKFPWQKGIVHYARLLGMINTGDISGAENELNKLKEVRDLLTSQKDEYKARQVEVQYKTGEAWLLLKKRNTAAAVKLMTEAADQEDATEKHPVTPGEVLPAREMLANMYMELSEPAQALEEYEKDLKRHPNRFNALFGAAVAAQRSGDSAKAAKYYSALSAIAVANTKRVEAIAARHFLKNARL